MQSIIFHIDGDAFFASCEQSTNIRLRGKPVAVGAERGIVTAYSYEAKRLGVTRALSGIILRKQFPEVLLVYSDYRKYSLFSQRMVSIVRQYTDTIEYASIDECYADMSGVVTTFAEAEVFARKLQDELCLKLGLTMSIGVGSTKSLAKISSGLKKPRGVTVIYPERLMEMFATVPIQKVSGIGSATAQSLMKLGVLTVGSFIEKDELWVAKHGNKTLVEIHKELRGIPVRAIVCENEVPKSVSKMHTFREPVTRTSVLLAKLSEQCEVVARKLWKEGLMTGAITFGVIRLPHIHEMDTKTIYFDTPTNDPSIFFRQVEANFSSVHDAEGAYRAVGVSTHGRLFSAEEVHPDELTQVSLFENTTPARAVLLENKKRDVVSMLLATLPLKRGASMTRSSAQHTSRATIAIPTSKYAATPLIKTATGNMILDIPYLGTVS